MRGQGARPLLDMREHLLIAGEGNHGIARAQRKQDHRARILQRGADIVALGAQDLRQFLRHLTGGPEAWLDPNAAAPRQSRLIQRADGVVGGLNIVGQAEQQYRIRLRRRRHANFCAECGLQPARHIGRRDA